MNSTPIHPSGIQTKKLMELLGMPVNVSEFTIRGKWNDCLEVELTYLPSIEVFDTALERQLTDD